MGRKRAEAANPQPPIEPLEGPLLVVQVLELPRIGRMILAAFFAIALTLVLTPLIDAVYLQYFFSMDTRMLPSLLAAVSGLLAYLLGWWLIVGTAGEPPAPGRAALLYLIAGFICVGLMLLWLGLGVYSNLGT